MIWTNGWCASLRIWLSVSIYLLMSAETPADDHITFQQVVEKHYHRWVPAGTGALTDHRVKELVLSAEVRGAEAAAIAAIHCYQKKLGKDAHQLTLEFLHSKHKEDPSLRRDHLASGANVSQNFHGFLKHIQSAPRQLFAVEHPSLDTVTQGNLGDCYFVAAVGAIANRHPESLLKMIHPKPDHSFEVRFPNGRSAIVPKLTDAQLALSSNAGQQGVWLNVLEIAAGQIQLQSRKNQEELPLDTVGGGGDSGFSIELLTNHKVHRHPIRHVINGDYPAPAEKEVDKLATKISQSIREAVDHHRIICCGTPKGNAPPGIITHHVYAVLGLKQGRVDIWNPWGYKYNFEPKGKPGIEHGYFVEGGRFSVPAHDFVKIFAGVNIESDEPLKQTEKPSK